MPAESIGIVSVLAFTVCLFWLRHFFLSPRRRRLHEETDSIKFERRAGLLEKIRFAPKSQMDGL